MLVDLFKCPVIWTQRTRPPPLDILRVWSAGAQEKKENFVLETSTFLAEFCVENPVLSEFPLGQDNQQRQIYLWNDLNRTIWASLPISIRSLGKIAQVFSFEVMFFRSFLQSCFGCCVDLLFNGQRFVSLIQQSCPTWHISPPRLTSGFCLLLHPVHET